MSQSTKLNLILQNIRSLRRNFDALLSNINALNIEFDILLLTETWITSCETCNYHLDGYSFIANCNDHHRACGVAAFIKSSLNYSVTTLNFISADVLKITVLCGKVKFCFVLIYRYHFFSFDTFLKELNDFLNMDKSKNKIILGDMNFNLLKDSQLRDDYLLLYASFGLDSLLNSVTRPSSNSCIDHVFSEVLNENVTVDVQNLQLDVTDHNTISLTLNLLNHTKKGRKYEPIFKTSINYPNLLEALNSVDWSEILETNDPNIAYSTFLEKLNFTINQFTTRVKIKRCNFKLKPWMTDSLMNLIKERNKLSKKLNRCHNDNLKINIAKLSSKIKILIPRLKDKYFKNKFNMASDLSAKWKIVNNILNKNCNSNLVSSIDIGSNEIETDNFKMANAFNDFFTKIPYTILKDNQETVSIDNIAADSLVNSRHSNFNLFLFPICENEILLAVSELKNSKSCGTDGITAITVKQIIFSIVDILVYIFNMCFSNGVFPEKLKVGSVNPLFKSGSHLVLNNYRPITLLNTFSKIFEKIIKSRLINYLGKLNFLDKRQFGFIKNSSTEKALISLLTPLHNNLNSHEKVSALFMDISKAFDTVNHKILLAKLSHIGIRGIVLNFFKSYLENRIQSVWLNGTYSDEQIVNIGVPQGSVLGPLLFLIYLNSIFDLKLHGTIVAFADDIALQYSHLNINAMKFEINEDLITLKKWFYVHDMILSCKSKIMYFNVSHPIQDYTPIIYHSLACINSNCNDFCISIEVVSSFKYLGLFLDSQLNFKNHVDYLMKKLRQALRSFYYLRNICSSEFLKCLYYALFDSHMQYGLTCWGGIYYSNIKPLITIQKAVLRINNHLPRMTPSFPLFVKYGILPFRYLYVFKVLKVYYVMSGNRSNNNYSTPYMFRNDNRIKIPRPNKEHFKKFFTYTAPKLYSQLPTNVRNAATLKDFCILLKKWLFSIADIEVLFKVII